MNLLATCAPDTFERAAEALLRREGFAGEPVYHRLAGGRNNRAVRVDVDGARLLIKAYFTGDGDQRDRLGSETSFARFAWSHGLRRLPRLIAVDSAARLAMFEFIDGRPLERGDVDADAIGQAVAFIGDLNRHREAPGASDLPSAAEACFSIGEHLACIERRMDRLAGAVNPHTPAGVERDAAAFVHGQLVPAWRSVRARLLQDLCLDSEIRIQRDRPWRLTDPTPATALDRPLPPADRVISPSDFGYHNAIVDARDGRLRFIDFEYAGWDDPAKLVCDFFCQPAVPVPMKFFDRFAAATAGLAVDSARCARRIAMLMPVYRIKWCCILLNEFIGDGAARRAFAGSSPTPSDERKATQLEKAQAMLASLDEFTRPGKQQPTTTHDEGIVADS